MVDAREKYVTDQQGNRVAVLLDVEEYRRLLDALDELESIRASDAAAAVREDAIPSDKAVAENRGRTPSGHLQLAAVRHDFPPRR